MPHRALRVIVNADDFGMDADTCEATIDCIERGIVSSATIMPAMPATTRACGYACGTRDVSYGVHLTFVRDTCEAPASPPNLVHTLVDEEGRFRRSHDVRLRALAGRIDEDEVSREVEAQLARVRDCGVPISHVDSHGHLHKFPVFRRALARVLPRFGLVRVRNEQNVYLRAPWRKPTYWLAKAWRPVACGPWRTTDWFYMPASDACDASWPERVLREPRGGTLEIGVHPGGAEQWRAGERKAAHRLKALLDERSIPLVMWNDL
jgi:predicted glycoside hydrolase/deacetylase ChbG (UPF0249 family)